MMKGGLVSLKVDPCPLSIAPECWEKEEKDELDSIRNFLIVIDD